MLALYHYEKIQGTTTQGILATFWVLLYHYEKIQGTAVNYYLYLRFNEEYTVSLQIVYSARYYIFSSILQNLPEYKIICSISPTSAESYALV